MFDALRIIEKSHRRLETKRIRKQREKYNNKKFGRKATGNESNILKANLDIIRKASLEKLTID